MHERLPDPSMSCSREKYKSSYPEPDWLLNTSPVMSPTLATTRCFNRCESGANQGGCGTFLVF